MYSLFGVNARVRGKDCDRSWAIEQLYGCVRTGTLPLVVKLTDVEGHEAGIQAPRIVMGGRAPDSKINTSSGACDQRLCIIHLICTIESDLIGLPYTGKHDARLVTTPNTTTWRIAGAGVLRLRGGRITDLI